MERTDIMKATRAVKMALRKNTYCLPEMREGLDLALDILREKLCEIDREHEIVSCISNKYVVHFNQELPEFEKGYNSAIRDVLNILDEGRYHG